jgi:hypothetical protein
MIDMSEPINKISIGNSFYANSSSSKKSEAPGNNDKKSQDTNNEIVIDFSKDTEHLQQVSKDIEIRQRIAGNIQIDGRTGKSEFDVDFYSTAYTGNGEGLDFLDPKKQATLPNNVIRGAYAPTPASRHPIPGIQERDPVSLQHDGIGIDAGSRIYFRIEKLDKDVGYGVDIDIPHGTSDEGGGNFITASFTSSKPPKINSKGNLVVSGRVFDGNELEKYLESKGKKLYQITIGSDPQPVPPTTRFDYRRP